MQEQIDEATAATDFDTIVVTLTQMGFYSFPADSKAVHVLDMHNIEHELLRRRAQVERRRTKRAGLALEARKFTPRGDAAVPGVRPDPDAVGP